MKKIISLLLIVSSYGYGQTPTNSYDVKTPNVADFIKYGNVSSMSNIGELKVGVPMLSLPVSGQNPIDVSLSYAGSGFRPSKRSGNVGYNWFLNVGGAITRQVNTVPDDQKGHPTYFDNTNYAHGFIIGVANKTHNPQDVFDFNPLVTYESDPHLARYLYGNATQTKTHESNYEPDPDIFSFNFNGISGKFFMGNDGQVKVITDSPNNIKVDLSQLAFQELMSINGCKPKPSKIILTDNQGNKYHFGGELKNLEYSLSMEVPGRSTKRPVITSWFLSRIEYYNGENVYFNYKDDSNLLPDFANEEMSLHGDFGNASHPENYIYRDFVVYSESYSNDLSEATDGNVTIAKGPNDPVYSIQKIAILDNITGDNFKVTFQYSNQPHPFNNRNSDTDNSPKPKISNLFSQFLDIKLDRVTLFDSANNEVKRFELAYDHFGGTFNSRMFLKSVTETGKMPYAFEYYPTGTLPKPITNAIDHWGYWNGRHDDTNRLIPLVDYVWASGDYTFQNSFDGTSRNSNFTYAVKGQLKKMFYPTGGYTEFVYEPHVYSKRLEGRSVNGFVGALYDVTDEAGGTRIKQVSDYDGFGITNVKDYKYVNNYASGGTVSSGIMFKWPRYHAYIDYPNVSASDLWLLIRKSSPIGNIIDNSPVIAYSEVAEVLNGNGYKVNKYSDYISNPDSDDKVVQRNLWPGQDCYPMGLAVSTQGSSLNDRSQERGKIAFEKIYDNSSNLKQATTFVYNNNPARFNNFTARMHTTGPVTVTNKIYHYSDFLTEKTTTVYNPTGTLVNVEKSTYVSVPNYNTTISNQDVLSKTSVTTSVTNELLETEYKYPWDIYASGSTEHTNFKNAHIYAPLRVSQFRNGTKISESFSLFGQDATTNNKLLLKNSYSAKFPNSNTTIANGIGQLEKKVTYDAYDAQGNIAQVTTENGTSIVIIWGYDKALPIAKIENATLAQVAAALGVTTTALMAYTESNMASLNGLRTNSSLPNIMVTTYTHLKLIGVSTITDPKGDTATYTYDVAGRLQNIKDKNGNVLSEYKYHYKNQ